jgi:hypothetical protein
LCLLSLEKEGYELKHAGSSKAKRHTAYETLAFGTPSGLYKERQIINGGIDGRSYNTKLVKHQAVNVVQRKINFWRELWRLVRKIAGPGVFYRIKVGKCFTEYSG